jgi:hypothetical protein
MAITQKARVAVQYIIPAGTAYLLVGAFLITGRWPNSNELTSKIGGIAVATLLATLAQDIMPKSLKEVLVFFRLNNRIPGHRAFSNAFRKPSRYNLDRFTNIAELENLEPEAQQRLFSRFTKSIRRCPMWSITVFVTLLGATLPQRFFCSR